MAVIKDVAQRAGVSIGTVSKFFNHPDSLRPSTYQKVARAVAELDYRPSAIARSMRTGHTNIVAIFVPEISNPFYAEAYSLLAAALNGTPFIPLLITTEQNPAVADMQKLSLMLSHADAAVLYLLDNRLNAQLIPFFAGLSLPCVVVSQRLESAAYTIVIQEKEGAHQAAQHLIDTGRRHIAFIGGPEVDLMTEDKLAGFQNALAEGKLLPHSVTRCPNFTPYSAYQAAAAIWAEPEETSPDALFCANDSLALGALRYLHEHGHTVPAQVALVGFDDLPLCQLSQPQLSSVALPLVGIAHHAASMLIQAAQDRSDAPQLASDPPALAPKPVLLPTALVVRESSRTANNSHLSLRGNSVL